jgi:hypothetical protein
MPKPFKTLSHHQRLCRKGGQKNRNTTPQGSTSPASVAARHIFEIFLALPAVAAESVVTLALSLSMTLAGHALSVVFSGFPVMPR